MALGTSNQSFSTVEPAKARLLVFTGVFFSLPGTILTCIPITIPGSILLIVGSLMLITSNILAFRYDWKRNFPGHDLKGHHIANWNDRVRFDCKLLFYVWLPVGSALACAGFVQYRHPLAIAGCSIVCFAVVIFLLGLILGHCLELEKIIRHTSNSASDQGSNTSYTQLFSDFQVLGTFLFIPGVCFSCVGWSREYDRIVAGIFGAILLSIGGMLVLISAFTVVCKANEVSEKRSAVSKITLMFFVSGVPLTAVGFTHLQPGLALGIAGACLSGLSLISFIARSCYSQEQTEGTTGVTAISVQQNRNESGYPGASNDPSAFGPHLGGYPTYTGSEIPNPEYPGTYSYPTDQSATGINPAYPPTNYGPSTTARSAANYKSRDIPMPIFQTTNIPSAPSIASSNTDQVDNAIIPPFQHVNEEDLPPPPSYDEVVKSGSNDSIA